MLTKLTLSWTPSVHTSNILAHASANLAVLQPMKRFIRSIAPLLKWFFRFLSMDEIGMISSGSGETATPVPGSCCTESHRSLRACPQYHARELEPLLKLLSIFQT